MFGKNACVVVLCNFMGDNKLVTKMSDMTRRFEVILTSFSCDECNGQFKFKIKWFVTSANELVRAR